jgi:translation initiation factor 1
VDQLSTATFWRSMTCYTGGVKNSRLVYSTDGGPVKEPAARSVIASRATPSRSATHVPTDGAIRLFIERGGRGGKVVTVIRGLPARGAALDALAAELRRLCGAGGTLEDGAVLIQGDQRDRVAEHLRGLGYTVKLAGG